MSSPHIVPRVSGKEASRLERYCLGAEFAFVPSIRHRAETGQVPLYRSAAHVRVATSDSPVSAR
jgi:hypothetical protein